jgi:hypothetical protein
VAPLSLRLAKTDSEPSGPVAKLDPLDHLQPVLGPPWTQEANGGQNIRPLGGLISWLLPGSFLGAIQRLFFDVRHARSSAIARRHIGAACWLVLVRLCNLKRPKSQFWSTMGSFSMIGLSGICMVLVRHAGAA